MTEREQAIDAVEILCHYEMAKLHGLSSTPHIHALAVRAIEYCEKEIKDNSKTWLERAVKSRVESRAGMGIYE